MKIPVVRGDIVAVDLAGAKGVEKKSDSPRGRPCIVVQNDRGNRVSPMTIVVPITDEEQFKRLPIQVLVTADELGVGGKNSVVECGQIRTIDADERVLKHLGHLADSAMARVDKALATSLGLVLADDPADGVQRESAVVAAQDVALNGPEGAS